MKKKEQRLWTIIACVGAVLLVLIIAPFARRSPEEVKAGLVASAANGSASGRPGAGRDGALPGGGGHSTPAGTGGEASTAAGGTSRDGSTSGTLGGPSRAGGAGGAVLAGSGTIGTGGKDGGGSPGRDGAGSKGTRGDGKDAGDKDGDGKDGDDAEGVATVGGRVRRADQPVPAARLSLTSEADASIVFADCDSGGTYFFADVQPGRYTITLISPASTSPRRAIELAGGEQRLGEDFNLPPTQSLTGRVASSTDGSGVPSARITMFSGREMIGSVTGAQDGSFELMPLDPGGYIARVAADEFQPGEFGVEIAAGNQTPLLFKLDPSRAVFGRVVLEDGSPAGGATVSLFGDGSAYADPWAAAGNFLCDGDGNFRMSSIPGGVTGAFRVGAIRKESVPAFSAPLESESDSTFSNPVQVTLPSGLRITGRVVDKDNKGIPGATVQVIEGFATTAPIFQRLARPYPSAASDDAGNFTITAVEPGATKLRVSATGYTSVDKAVQASFSPTSVGDVKLKSLDDPEAGRVAGIVLTETGEPVVGADIYVKCLDSPEGGGNGYMRTDGTGNFVFEDMPDGTYSIVVAGSIMRQGVFIPIGQTYAGARAGEAATVLLFDHGQSVRAKVLDESGQPATRVRVGVAVQANLPGGAMGVQNKWEMRYDTEVQLTAGELVAGNLLHGTASLTISIPGGGSKELTGVGITAGGQTDLGEVRIGPGGSLAGRAVAQESSQGLPGVVVKAHPPAGAPPSHPLAALPFSTITTGDGAFNLTGLPAVQSADLSLSLDGRVTTWARNVQIPGGGAGDAGVIALPQAGTLRGLVQGPTGGGVPGILVRIGDIVVFTDGGGNYLSGIVPPGIVSVNFQDRTGVLGTVEDTAVINAGATTTLNITMTPKGVE